MFVLIHPGHAGDPSPSDLFTRLLGDLTQNGEKIALASPQDAVADESREWSGQSLSAAHASLRSRVEELQQSLTAATDQIADIKSQLDDLLPSLALVDAMRTAS